MSRIIETLQGINGLVSTGGVSEEEVDAYEKEHGITFSSEYKEYLMSFGVASCDCHELTGISKSKRLDVFANTAKWREKNNQIPIDYYVVEDLNIDDAVIWQDKKGEIYQTVGNSIPMKIAESFADYLLG